MAPSRRDSKGGGNLSLWGAPIERIESVEDGPPLDEHRSSSKACDAYSDGPARKWIRKRVRDTGRPELLAEVLGHLLAEELGVPTPRGAVTGTGEDLSWLSEEIPGAQHWSRHRAKYVQNLDDLGRMLALDAIAYNDDRHDSNILLQPRSSHVDLYAYSIDLGHSLLGRPRKLAKAGLDVHEIVVIAEGLPLPLLRDGALAAATQAEGFTRGQVAHMVKGACQVVGEPDVNLLLESLLLRTKNARALTARYIDKIAKFEKAQ
jgi:hypothetical protein